MVTYFVDKVEILISSSSIADSNIPFGFYSKVLNRQRRSGDDVISVNVVLFFRLSQSIFLTCPVQLSNIKRNIFVLTPFMMCVYR